MKTKIIFWASTTLIFLFEGVMPALTSQTEFAIAGITHLGYPVYFTAMLAICKVAGSIAIMVPAIPARIKEWAYAGFTFNLLAAATSLCIVDGFGPAMFFPLVVLAVLMTSYFTSKRLGHTEEEVVSLA